MLRAVDGDAPAVVSGTDVLAELAELLERRLPGVPLDDPAGPHLREMFALLRLQATRAGRRR